MNLPVVKTIRAGWPSDRILFAVVTFATKHEDGFAGCHWQLYDEYGDLITRGFSKRFPGTVLFAMKNASAAARRYLNASL